MSEQTTISLFDNEPQQQEKRVLGLDLGFKATGYYCKDVIGHFTSKGSIRGARTNDFISKVTNIIKENHITDVFFEWIDKEFVPNNNSEKATYVLKGLGLCVEAICAKLNVRCYPVDSRHWKMCLLGYGSNGYEKKDRVQNRLRHLGYKFSTPDEADAIGVWYYGKNNVDRLSYGK